MSEPWALTPQQAGDLLNLSARTVYEMLQRGELPAIKLRGKTRIRRDDLAAWLASQPMATPRADHRDEDVDLDTLDEVLRARGTH